MNRNTPALTISPRHFQFNKAVHEKLGRSQAVEILYHPFLQALVIRACPDDAPNAFQWENEDGSLISTISVQAFCKSIYDEMLWLREYRFKFRGITRVRGNSQMMIFFLDEPQILPGKGSSARSEDTASDNAQTSVKYIPYKRTENSASHVCSGIFLPLPIRLAASRSYRLYIYAVCAILIWKVRLNCLCRQVQMVCDLHCA